MKDRLFYLRKSLYNLSRAKFGEPIGMTDSEIKNIETGKTILKDNKIPLICSKYNVNEKWLRTGEGEPLIKPTEEDEIVQFMTEVLQIGEDDTYENLLKKKLVKAIAKLSPDAWKKLSDVAAELAAQEEEKTEQDE